MSEPRPEVRAYIESRYPGARIDPIAGDASTRSFFRVFRDRGPSVVVMDYGRSLPGEPDDIVLNRIFVAAGLPVAGILEQRHEVGFLILEDLGSRSLETILTCYEVRDGGEPPPPLVQAARLAAQVSDRGTPVLAGSERSRGPALDAARFRFEMEFFLEHYADALTGVDSIAPGLRRGLLELADLAADTPRAVLCHRDFHSRNLMFRDDGTLAMVDIQDARWGPDSYDLASLVYDAYLESDAAWLDPLIRAYLAELSSPPPEATFRNRLHLVAAQRMIKALGTFGFQVAVAGRARYREPIPRTLQRLRRLLPAQAVTQGLERMLRSHGLI